MFPVPECRPPLRLLPGSNFLECEARRMKLVVPAMGLPRSAPSESTEVATWPGVLRVGDLGERFDTGNRWISFKGVSYFRYIFCIRKP